MGSSKVILVLALAGFVVGCASNSKDIRASYTSPMTYDGYSCEQLVQENQRLQLQISSVAGDVDKRANGDKMKMGVGLVFFWPTLFFLKGDGPQAQEYARLKGEHEALEGTYVRKNCASALGVALPAPIPSHDAGAPVEASDARTVALRSYGGAAKSEFAKMNCDRDFKFVNANNDHEIYEATCQGGNNQLLECDSVACRTIK
jgi:hypothetical protein